MRKPQRTKSRHSHHSPKNNIEDKFSLKGKIILPRKIIDDPKQTISREYLAGNNRYAFESKSDRDYVITWADAPTSRRYGVSEKGFFWNAVHIDTVGLYASCSLNTPQGNKEILEYNAPISARELIFNSKSPQSKFRQSNKKIKWEGIVLALQNPTDRSIRGGNSPEGYYEFVEDACRHYGKNLFLKLHPWNRGEVESRFREIAKKYNSPIDKCNHTVLDNCRFVLTYNSTFVVDCLLRNIPVAQYSRGYFWQTPAVYYTNHSFPDNISGFNSTHAQKVCDFLLWKYCFDQGTSASNWIKILESFATSKQMFPLPESCSYAASIK